LGVWARASELSQVEFDGAGYTVCKVDLRKDRLALFLMAPDGRPYANFERLAATLKTQKTTLGFAMNAGMYEADLGPVGLFISGGTEYAPLNLKAGKGNFFLKPNGVFAVVAGKALIVPSPEWPAVSAGVTVELATQSGPLLVSKGLIHTGLSPTSKSLHVRNAIAVLSPDEVCLVISERPVTFYQLARFLKDGLGCADGLYLDGAISSIYAPSLGRNDAKHNLGPIIGLIREAGME